MNSSLTRNQELENKISDLEETLHDLKHQLHAQSEAEQHDAIDHLEDYLEQVDHKYANFREFVEMLLVEVRGLFAGESNKDREI